MKCFKAFHKSITVHLIHSFDGSIKRWAICYANALHRKASIMKANVVYKDQAAMAIFVFPAVLIRIGDYHIAQAESFFQNLVKIGKQLLSLPLEVCINLI